MNLKFFRAPDYNNFGDELNPYIFNHLFSEIFSLKKYAEFDFYGIGSIIDSRISADINAILFGTGIRDITKSYVTKKWDVRFLRGPISSNVLGFRGEKYIADAAYCMLCDESLLPVCKKKRFKISIMPHYRQMDKLDWGIIMKMAGVNIIDPREPIEQILQDIADSEKLLAIAMHGAIVADILRVPWQRIKMEAIGAEKQMISDMKWLDFISALDLKDNFVHIKNFDGVIKRTSPWFWITYYEIIRRIKASKRNGKFQLSTDKKLMEVKQKLDREINLFKIDYA